MQWSNGACSLLEKSRGACGWGGVNVIRVLAVRGCYSNSLFLTVLEPGRSEIPASADLVPGDALARG